LKILLGKTTYKVLGDKVKFTIPALSTVVLKANKLIDTVKVKTGNLSVVVDDMTGYYQVSGGVTLSDLFSVDFFIKSANDTAWSSLGTDTNAPYEVFINPADLQGQSQVQLSAIATDSKGKQYTFAPMTYVIPTS